MGLVETLIIVFGVLCGFFLILLVLILWKYVKNIRKSKDGKFYKGVKTFPSMDEDDGVDVGPRVEWNFVAPQLPVEPYDPKALDDPKLTPSSRRKDYSKKPVNPKIRKLKKTKNMSRSLNSLDVIGKSEEIDLGSDHLSITTDETTNRSRRRSYGSDISDVSCTSARCIKQEKINTQMMESLRNGKRKDSTMSISPKYNNGRLSLGNVGRNSTDGGPIKSPLANEPGRMSLDIGRNSPLVKKKWISLDDAPMSADNLSEYGSDFGGSSIALDESKSGSSNIRRRFAQTRNSNRSFEYKIVGNLIVSVEYKESDNKLTLWIHRASGLGGDRREDPEISSFVRMYLIPGKKQKQESSVIRGAKDPHYEETFTFNNIIPSELSAQKLRFKVYNSPSFSVKNELLGEGNIFLSTLKSDDKEVFHLDLLKKKSKISSASVEISLCHQGTYSKLEVIIHQAKNLVRKSNAMINPYAKVSFYKDGSVETKETTHQTNERNPIFNESLDFNANTDVGSPLTTYSLVVTIMHHSILRKDSPIGHVIFTLNSPQETAEKHFKMAENDPHRRITEWHKLIDPDDV